MRIVLVLYVLYILTNGERSVKVEKEKEKILYIAGIFPISGSSGWQGGQAGQPATMLALEDVNKHKDLLPGYKLNLTWSDSKCEPGLGATAMYDLLYNPPQKLLLIGGCSTVCTTVAEAAKMWNLIVLSFGSSSPALSDRKRFPTFFRTHPSATVHNPTRIKLFQMFGWSRIAILQQAEEVFISTVEDLEKRCKVANIEIVTRQSFLTDPTDAMRNLRRQDARIIVGLFYVVAARRALCEIYKQGLYGKSYVWFFIGWYEDAWYNRTIPEEKLTCTPEQMTEAANGHLTTEALMWHRGNERTVSGKTVDGFKKKLDDALRKNNYDLDSGKFPEGYQEAPLAYDAVWATALALNKTMMALAKKNKRLEDFVYSDTDIANEIYDAMDATQFLGVSGRVAFSSEGDRIALTQIEQMVDGKYHTLGFFDTQMDNLTWLIQEKWLTGKVPQDRTIIREQLKTVSVPLFIAMCTISVIGIIVALCLIVFNFYYRKKRLIRFSQPVCNIMTLAGTILCLLSVCLLGLDGSMVPPYLLPSLCQFRTWLLVIGFSLSYGAMFTKIWLVHQHNTHTKAKQEVTSDGCRRPWLLVVAFIVVDVIILLSWQIADPLQRTLRHFPLEEPPDATEDIKIRPVLEQCNSHNNTMWLGMLYAYKGVLLMFGLLLAYETRSVKVRGVRDSRYVGMAIYNVVVLCVITAPVSLVIASQPDASYAFVGLAVVFCAFLSMALIYVPKIVEVVQEPSDRNESRQPSGPGSSREDEEKYNNLLKENEELKQLIAEKDEKIRLLKLKLQERAAIHDRKKDKNVSSGRATGGQELQTLLMDFEPNESYL